MKRKWFSSLNSRLIIISLLPVLGGLISLLLLIISMSILSSARAYVGSESLWSKAQKQSTYHLLKYGSTRSEDDYIKAIEYLEVTKGDKQAREEMNKPNPNKDVIREGFTKGGIHPKDIEGMIWLYRNFKTVGYFSRPIAVWAQGDELISQLTSEAERLHGEVQSSSSNAAIAARLTKIDNLDSKLTLSENQFSFLMGEASRWILGTLITINTVVLLGVMAITFRTIKILNRRLLLEFNKIHVNTKLAVAGDYSNRVGTLSIVELNSLAKAFNTLIEAVSRSEERLIGQLEISRASRDEAETSKKHALQLLKELNREKAKVETEKAKDEAILSNIADGLFVVDDDKKIVLFNNAATRISGYKSSDVIGKSYEKIIRFTTNDDSQPENNFIVNALQGKIASMGNEAELKHANGTIIPVANTAAPLITKNSGSVNGAIIVFRDVTEERELSKAKTEFVSLASHQLRTPLAAISWYTEMLLGGGVGKVNKEQVTYLQEILSGNNRMIDLVNYLLDISRIDTHTFVVEPEPVDLIALAKDITREAEPDMFKRKQQLVEKYTSKKLETVLDSRLTRIVIQNLLSNASKYSKTGGRITLKIYSKKSKFYIVVEDSGIGIPKDQQPMIFNKLYRASNVTKIDTEGMGLGLYVVKSIVENTGGKVWFKSSENIGTSFVVEYPLSGMKAVNGSLSG